MSGPEDMILWCKNVEYKVHRALFHNQSRWFGEEIDNAVEDDAGMITVDVGDEDNDLIELIIQYMYDGDYIIDFDATDYCCILDPAYLAYLERQTKQQLDVLYDDPDAAPSQITPDGIKDWSPTHMVGHLFLYDLTIKYRIPHMKHLVRQKFKMCAKAHKTSPVFAIAVLYVWSSTVDEYESLRDVTAKILAAHLELWELLEMDDWMMPYPELALAVQAMRGE